MELFNSPINENKLENRADVAHCLINLLNPCGNALVHDNTGLFVGTSSALYSPRVALFEGWSRLLWGIVPLRAGGYNWKDQDKHFAGIKEGTDPHSKNYWGDFKYADQKIVELAALAFSLLLTPEYYWDPLTLKEKDNLCTWLAQVNINDFPHNNWLFFRVLVNVAFEKLKRKEFDSVLMENDLNEIEAMYVSDGWYRDRDAFDYYNPWGFHYYSLIYIQLREKKDGARCKRMRERIHLFASQFKYYLNDEGVNIPFGRSPINRFTALSFYGACAFANIEIGSWGEMKGIVLRNLRWWFRQPILDCNGFITMGYAYPSLFIGEEYNSPESPYYCLQNFIILALPPNHPFWTAKELPLSQQEKQKLLPIPGVLMQRTSDDDVVMLNAGQYPSNPVNQNAEKYSKFAYSAHYGFSAASSYFSFAKCGCDSMLYFKDDGGYYRPRRAVRVLEKNENYIATLWHPFDDITVTTYLLPCDDFHLRVHKIESDRAVTTKEGGFAIPLYHDNDLETPVTILRDNTHSIDVTLPWDGSMIEDITHVRTATFVKPTPNLNCFSGSTIVPLLEGSIKAGCKITYITLVGASRNSKTFYGKRPQITWDEETSIITIHDKKVILKSSE